MDLEGFPKDETLRLILAKDQEQWIRQKLRESRQVIWLALVVLVASILWASIFYDEGFDYFNRPKCFILVGEGADHALLRKEFLAEGLKPCPPMGAEIAEPEMSMEKIKAWVTFSSLILILISTLTLIRHLYLLIKFKGYLSDHLAFMAKYNRSGP